MEEVIEKRKCVLCGNEYPKTKEFFNTRYKTNGKYLSTYCKSCEKEKVKEKMENNWVYRLKVTTHGNKKRKGHKRISGSVTQNDIKKQYEKQNGMCYWLNIPLDITFADKLRCPSIDRLDNTKGYTPDNIIITSRFANLGRRDNTADDFKLFIETYLIK